MIEDQSDWKSIGIALKCVLSKYDLDLTGVGTTPRLAYSDFEKIFYHLFMMVDPPDCRRQFWSLYPARNQEEKSKFIEEATIFINNKHLNSQKITSSQLRMCGGEPFRRILMSLIKKASEQECTSIGKKLNRADSNSNDNDLSQLLNNLATIKATALEKSDELQSKLDKYNKLQGIISEKNENMDHLWSIITTDNKSEYRSADESAIKEIYKSLLTKLEKNDLRRKAALEKIRQIPVPNETVSIMNASRESKAQTSIRMSHLFREIRQHLTLSPEASASPQVDLESNIRQQLLDYDQGVEDLISIWEKERDRAHEALLATPEMQERYKLFESLIPLVQFEPINAKAVHSHDKISTEILETLKEFPDPRYDDEEILKALKRHLEEHSELNK